MANWEKLNKEFDDALDSMTSEDWELLASKRIKQTTRTMTTQLAVEWLEDYIQKEINKYRMQPMDLHAIHALNHIKEFACSKAKEMEKERLEDAYRTGIWDLGCRSTSFEEYYNRTFKQQQ